ncbi:MAG: CPBP family intramembrane metalloprotease [Deltaproteobacteria bacterium]|nr:CPBP family intramembrane metalloprotease [Deltaproteobacteria bacterium]
MSGEARKVPAAAAIAVSVMVVGLMILGTLCLFLISYVLIGEGGAASFANTFFIQCIVFTSLVGGWLLAGTLLGARRGAREILGLMPVSWSVVLLSALAGALLTFPLGELDNLWQLVWPASSEEAAMMIAVHDPDSAFERVFIILALVAAAPVGEELVFRGFLWTWVRTHAGKTAALVVTAVLFGCAHVFLARTIPLIIPVGFLLGWLVLRTGSVATSIAAHAAFNGTPLLASWSGLVITGWNNVAVEHPHQHPAVLAAGTAVFLACLAGIFVLTRPRPPRIDVPPGVH